MIRLLGLALFVSAVLLIAPAVQARTEGGDLLWEADFDLAGGDDRPATVAASHGRVVVVGSATDALGNSDFVVRAHDANTGALLWSDRVDLAGGVGASVVMDDRRVIASTPSQLRAYDAETGALAWTVAQGGSLALDGRHLIVGSSIVDAAGVPRPIVRAYDARDGVLAWTGEPGDLGHGGAIVAIRGGKAFMAAAAVVSGQVAPCLLVRANDLVRGTLLWETVAGTGICFPSSIASDGNRVVIAGLGGAADGYLVLAVDAKTGEFVWEDVTHPAGFNSALAVDIAGRRTFVAGGVDVPSPSPHTLPDEGFSVRSYDTETGTLLWHDEFPGPGGIVWKAEDIEAASGRAFAVGQSLNRDGTWLVRAYDHTQGAVLWEDEFQPVREIGDNQLGLAIAVDGGRVFVSVAEVDAAGNVNLILRAYDAK